MAKTFGRKDVYEDNIFDPLVKDVNEAIIIFNKFDAEVKTTASSLKKLFSGKQKFDSVKSINEVNNATKESNSLLKEALRLEQEKAKLDKIQSEALRAQKNAKIADLNLQKKQNAEKKKELTSYQLESRALNEMRNRYKDLAVQREKGVKLTRDERNEMRSLLTQINQTDASLKKIDASVGQNQRNVGNYTKALGGVKNVLGQLGVAFSVFQIGGFIGKTLIDFEENASNMAKTLNISVGEAKNLSRELANIDTRTSIGDLQGIAAIGGQLGIGAGEIVAFTESIDKLNVALGDEFTGGAEEITSVLGGLRNVLTDIKTGNTADDLLKIGNALNVLGAEGSATSPVVSDFAGRISGIGIPLGLTSDEILGLSATLQELNVNAERGGTAVGAILQRITKDTKGFAQLAGMPVKDFENLLNEDLLGAFKAVTKGFSTLRGDAVKQSQALDKLKLTGSGASEVFLKLGGSIDLLEKRVKQSGEALQETDSITKEFEVKNNTLGATVEKLSTEFQKYVLGLDEAGHVTGALSTVLQFLVSNMQTILKLVYEGAKAWVLYKTAMMSLKLYDQFQNFRNLGGGIKDVSGGLKDGAQSAKAFGMALKSIGFAVIVDLLIQTFQAIKSIVDESYLLETRLNSIQAGIEGGAKASEFFVNKVTDALKNRQQQIGLMNISEKERVRLNKEAISNAQKELKVTTGQVLVLYKEANQRRLNLKAMRDKAQASFNLVGASVEEAKQLRKLEDEYAKSIGTVEKYRVTLEGIRTASGGLEDDMYSLDAQQTQVNVTTGKATKATKELNTQLKEQNRYLSEQLSLNQQLRNEYSKNRVDYEQGLVDDELMKQVESARGTGEFDNTLTKYKELINQRTDASIDGLKQEYEFRVSELNRTLEEEHKAELKAITEERDEKLKQEGLTEAQRLIIQQQFNDQLKKLDDDKILRQLDNGRRQLLLEEQLKDDKFDVIKQGEQDVIDAKSKTLEAQKEFLDELGTATTEKTKENAKKEIEYIDYITKYLEDSYDRRIAKLNEFVEASKQAQDDIRELARNGEVEAQQSIALEAQLQREATAEAQRLERQKQLALSISAFLQSFNNKLLEKNADGTPKYKTLQALAEAGAEKAVVDSFLKAIPAFKDGGVHKDGGLMLVNDAPGSSFREIIETPKGDLYSPEGRNVIMNAPAGTKIHTQDQWNDLQNSMRAKDAFRNANSLGGNVSGNSYDLIPITKELKNVEKAIKDIPDHSYEIKQTLAHMLTLITTERKGSTTNRVIHQYRTKK